MECDVGTPLDRLAAPHEIAEAILCFGSDRVRNNSGRDHRGRRGGTAINRIHSGTGRTVKASARVDRPRAAPASLRKADVPVRIGGCFLVSAGPRLPITAVRYSEIDRAQGIRMLPSKGGPGGVRGINPAPRIGGGARKHRDRCSVAKEAVARSRAISAADVPDTAGHHRHRSGER